MNRWQATKQRSGWHHHGLKEWSEGNTTYLSVVFSWNLQDAFQRAVWSKALGHQVTAGGPAVKLQPEYLMEVAQIENHFPDAVAKHNPNATFTSRGCVRKCKFCLVPELEGDLVELDDWPVRPIICDNNLLACSRAHFDRVIDKLKPLKQVDFNQGLDARMLTQYHAERLTELDLRCVRLAWDHTQLEERFRVAFQRLRKVGIPTKSIRVYVMIGYNDTPEDALYRLETVWKLKAWPFPMRYQPLNAIRRNAFVGEHWTHAELQRYVHYWSNLRYLAPIPFKEFRG